MKTKSYMSLPVAFGFLLFPLSGIAGENTSGSATYFSNPLFNILLVAIILLLIVNVVLAQALKNISQSDYITSRFRENKDGTSVRRSLTILFFLFLLNNADAQNGVGKSWDVGGIDSLTFYFMMGIIVLELIIMTVLLRLIRTFLEPDVQAETKKETDEQSVILQKLTGAVAIEKENEIMLDHEYDGIRELDNDLPPWWKYGFYLTIIVSVVYLIHYHVANTGDLQITEYNKEVEKGKLEVAEFMKNAAGNVDESTVKMLEGSDLEHGKQVFISTCAACHGKLGEGGVGPNLTDAYWVHGGSLSDIFKSIKYGWPDKGMKSWKEDLSPVQIAQVTSFIRSIIGTSPPNGKAPQGDLYKEELIAVSDSLKKDSLKSALPVIR